VRKGYFRARVAERGAAGENAVMEASLAPAVDTLLVLLAIGGAAAVGFRLLRSVARLGIAAAEVSAVSGLMEVSARRGDLTALAERRRHVRAVRRIRRRSAAGVLAWLALLLMPLALGWAREAFAVSSLLWLVPTRPLRVQAPPAEAE
jgi:hypothetical protein